MKLWAKIVIGIAIVVATLITGVMFLGFVTISTYENRAARSDLSKMDEMVERSAVYFENGELHGYFGGKERLIVPLKDVSKHFIDALIAREDNRFWKHDGVDPFGILRAAFVNLRRRIGQGGGEHHHPAAGAECPRPA